MSDSIIPATDAPVRLLAAFYEAFPSLSAGHILQAPGRAMWVAAATGTGSAVYSIAAPEIGGKTTFNWRSAKLKKTVLHRPLPSWARYSAGVIVALCASGLDIPAVSAVIVGDEPPGPRYDHAMGMTVAALWHHLSGKPYTADSLLEIVERVRRDYVEG